MNGNWRKIHESICNFAIYNVNKSNDARLLIAYSFAGFFVVILSLVFMALMAAFEYDELIKHVCPLKSALSGLGLLNIRSIWSHSGDDKIIMLASERANGP